MNCSFSFYFFKQVKVVFTSQNVYFNAAWQTTKNQNTFYPFHMHIGFRRKSIYQIIA